jgi:hypothetical protein
MPMALSPLLHLQRALFQALHYRNRKRKAKYFPAAKMQTYTANSIPRLIMITALGSACEVWLTFP